MRGSKAKAIRRMIYGEMATNSAGRRYFRAPSGQIFTGRPRMIYQLTKKYQSNGGT